MAGIIAALPEPLGSARRQLYVSQAAGPATYATAGFTINTGLSTIEFVSVTPQHADLGLGAGTVPTVRATVSAGTITVQVYALSAGTSTWATLPASTDLSGQTFDVVAIGYHT